VKRPWVRIPASGVSLPAFLAQVEAVVKGGGTRAPHAAIAADTGLIRGRGGENTGGDRLQGVDDQARRAPLGAFR